MKEAQTQKATHSFTIDYKPEIQPLSKNAILSTKKEPEDPTTMVKGFRQEEKAPHSFTIDYKERCSDKKGIIFIHN